MNGYNYGLLAEFAYLRFEDEYFTSKVLYNDIDYVSTFIDKNNSNYNVGVSIGRNEEVLKVYNHYNVIDFKSYESGMQVTLLQEKTTGKYIISYRGTEMEGSELTKDLIYTDAFGMGINILPNNQFNDSIKLTKDWINEFGLTDDTCDLVGHSLGGSLAQLNSYVFGFSATTYNAFGLDAALVEGDPVASILDIYQYIMEQLSFPDNIIPVENTNNIINYFLESTFQDIISGSLTDIVGLFTDKHIGENIVIKDITGGYFNIIGDHSITKVNDSIYIYESLMESFNIVNYSDLTNIIEKTDGENKFLTFLNKFAFLTGSEINSDYMLTIKNIKDSNITGNLYAFTYNNENQINNLDSLMYSLLENESFILDINFNHITSIQGNEKYLYSNYSQQFINDKLEFLNKINSNYTETEITYKDMMNNENLFAYNDILLDLKYKIFGSNNDDLISGDNLNDNLYGMSGIDTINGYGGDDYIEGNKDNDTLSGGSGSDTYVYNLGDGFDVINETTVESERNQDTIIFNNIDYSTASFQLIDNNLYINVPNGGVKIENWNSIDYSITLEKVIFNFNNTETIFTKQDLISKINFSGSTLLFFSDIDFNFITNQLDENQNTTLHTGSGNDEITSNYTGYFYTGSGDDKLISTGSADLHGGIDQDTYIINSLHSNAVFEENGEGFDFLKIENIKREDVTFELSGLDLVMKHNGMDVVHIKGWLNYQTGTNIYDFKIEEFIFQDNETYTTKTIYKDIINLHPDIELELDTYFGQNITNPNKIGTSSDDVLIGNDFNDNIYAVAGDDIIIGGNGNDKLHGYGGNDILDGGLDNDELYGREDDDTYIFKKGYGHDIIKDEYISYYQNVYAGNDTVRFEGININEVNFDSNGLDLLVTLINNPNDSLLIKDFFKSNSQGTDTDILSKIETFVFNDITLTYQDVLSYMNTINVISSFIWTDTIVDLNINASDLNNTIKLGSGNYYIESHGGDDTIYVKNGINTVYAGLGNDTLVGGDHSDGMDFFFGEEGNDLLIGYLGNDYLDGGSGDDVIYGETSQSKIGNNNDVLIGGTGNDLLYGGADNDEYIYSRGDGQDTIHDYNYDGWDFNHGGNDTLRLTDISIDDVEFKTFGNDLVLAIRDTSTGPDEYSDIITIKDYIKSDGNNTDQIFKIENFIFNNNITITSENLLEHMGIIHVENDFRWADTSSKVHINGSELNNSIFLGSGDDIVDANGGNDYIYTNAGDDTILFSKGDDYDTVNDNNILDNDTIKIDANLSEVVFYQNNDQSQIQIDYSLNDGNDDLLTLVNKYLGYGDYEQSIENIELNNVTISKDKLQTMFTQVEDYASQNSIEYTGILSLQTNQQLQDYQNSLLIIG